MGTNDKHYKAMRWLYEDEKTYRKAVAKLKLEELKARREKELIRRYRKRQLRIIISRSRLIWQKVVGNLKTHLKSRRSLALVAILIAGAVTIGVYAGINTMRRQSPLKPVSEKPAAGDQVQPAFQVVTPLDKPDIAQVPGPNSTYDPEKQVLSFTDTFMGESFTVSEQPLPDNFRGNNEALGNLAASLGSKELLDTQHGPVYVATNLKNRDQTAIIRTDKLLMFLRTPRHVDDIIWQQYINKLDFS